MGCFFKGFGLNASERLGVDDQLENFGSRLDMKNYEKEYYPLIKTKIEKLLNTRVSGFYLEIAADKNIS